ncbi:MAG: tetratricopeptide repeat protein [Victivallales bacterium]|nr:tetratricopeptide repeat protein [Victivallales bacterium]
MHLIKPAILGLVLIVALHRQLFAQESSRPTFLFPTAPQSSANSGNARGAVARQEGETAMAMHAPELAEEKFTEYCALTPANLPEGGTARRLLVEAQLAYAEALFAQNHPEAAVKKVHDALQTAEYYLVLPEIHPTDDDRDRLDLLRAHALLHLDRAGDALQLLMNPDRALTDNAHGNPVHWEALRLAARLQLASREWTAVVNLLAPYFEQAAPQRQDAELLMLLADAELGRGDFISAANHYSELQTLLPLGNAAPGETKNLAFWAPLHRIRALAGVAGGLVGEERDRQLDEIYALYRELAPLHPVIRDTEWGTAAWCLANEFSRREADNATTIQLLQDAWETLPYSDPHWVESGMLLAQLLHQQNDSRAKDILEELRVKCPDSPKFGEFSLQLAEYRKEANDRTRAAEIFDELAKRNNLDAAQRARAAFGAAECLALEGKLEQALIYYRQAADQAESRQAVTALLHAAQAAKNADDLETAIALQVETADRYGKPAATAEESDDARKLRIRAAEARLEAALLRRQSNQPDDLANAIAMLDVFQQDAPDSPRHAEARLERILMQATLAGNDPERMTAVQNNFLQFAKDATLDERLRTVAFFECARIALRRNDILAANRVLENFLATFPQSPYALRAAHRCALLAMQTDNSSDAQSIITQVVEKWPGSVEAAQLTLLLADSALSSGTPAGFQEALQLYRQVRPPLYTDEASLAQAHFETANCLYLMAQDANPEQFLEATQTDTAPAEPAAPAQLQLVEQAIAELAQVPATATPSLYLNVVMLRGELLALSGHPSEAREQFQSVREQAGDSNLGLAALGRMAEMKIAEAGNADLSMTTEKFQEAIDAFAYILTHTTNDELLAMAHFRTAQCHRELGQFRDAGKNYEDAIRHYKEICVNYEGATALERSPRYYTLAVFELAELAEEMADPVFIEQAAQFLMTYAQHPELPFAENASKRANELLRKNHK